MSTIATSTVAIPSSIAAAPFALVTPFSAPAGCDVADGGFTMLENDAFRVWLNAILPVPGGIRQAAFSPLVCPSGYSTIGPFTSSYIACCPSGWDGLATASDAPPDRPAASGTCYTNIYNVPIRVTLYDDTGIKASSIFTAPNSQDQAFAMVYEGFASGVAVLQSTTSSQTVTFNTAISTSKPPTATSSSSSSMSSSSSIPSTPITNVSTSAVVAVMIGGVIGISLIIISIVFLCRGKRPIQEEPDRPPKVPPKHLPWDDYWQAQISQYELSRAGYSVVKEETKELPSRTYHAELDGGVRRYEIG